MNIGAGEILLLLFCWIALASVFSGYCYTVAKSKNYNTTAWAIGGFLFWFIPLIAIAGMPVKEPK